MNGSLPKVTNGIYFRSASQTSFWGTSSGSSKKWTSTTDP